MVPTCLFPRSQRLAGWFSDGGLRFLGSEAVVVVKVDSPCADAMVASCVSAASPEKHRLYDSRRGSDSFSLYGTL